MSVSNIKYYRQYTVTSNPYLPEILSAYLWELEPAGIEEEANSLKLFFYDSEFEEAIADILESLKSKDIIFSFSIVSERFENKNWNEEWEQNLSIINVSNRITIRPSTKQYIGQQDEIVLVIDPKMSFGTGEHQTTKLVLRALEKYIQTGVKVLDVGTGTGVLAIAAVKLGASFALAIDNDDWCLENGLENRDLNEVSAEQIEVRTAEIQNVSDSDFDIVMANIQKNILLEICDKIIEKTKAGGTIILSGLLHQDEEDIVFAYTKAGALLVGRDAMDEWISLVFVKE